MEPKLDLPDIELSNDNTITLSSTKNTSITSPSTYKFANTCATTTVSGGGYTVPNVGITAGTGVTYPYVTTTGISSPWSNTVSPKIKLDGEGADIEVNGESLIGMIKKIEERLNILHPNEKMEAEWEELRKLGEQYRALEAKLKEQGEMWAKLKAMPAPEID